MNLSVTTLQTFILYIITDFLYYYRLINESLKYSSLILYHKKLKKNKDKPTILYISYKIVFSRL